LIGALARTVADARAAADNLGKKQHRDGGADAGKVRSSWIDGVRMAAMICPLPSSSMARAYRLARKAL